MRGRRDGCAAAAVLALLRSGRGPAALLIAARGSVPALRPGKAAPTEPVDSMGVPGRFCLWIPKY